MLVVEAGHADRYEHVAIAAARDVTVELHGQVADAALGGEPGYETAYQVRAVASNDATAAASSTISVSSRSSRRAVVMPRR